MTPYRTTEDGAAKVRAAEDDVRAAKQSRWDVEQAARAEIRAIDKAARTFEDERLVTDLAEEMMLASADYFGIKRKNIKTAVKTEEVRKLMRVLIKVVREFDKANE